MYPFGKSSRFLTLSLLFTIIFTSNVPRSVFGGYFGNYEAPLQYALNGTDLPCGAETEVKEGEKFIFDSASLAIYESSQYASQSPNNQYNRMRRKRGIGSGQMAKIQGRNYGHNNGGGGSGYHHAGGNYGGGSGGGGYAITPSVCQWTFFASEDCSLEMHIVRFKAGDMNCYKQELSVSDNVTDYNLCGNRKLYPGFRAETPLLYIKYWRLPYTNRHVFKGYVTCVGRAQGAAYDESHPYYTPEVRASEHHHEKEQSAAAATAQGQAHHHDKKHESSSNIEEISSVVAEAEAAANKELAEDTVTSFQESDGHDSQSFVSDKAEKDVILLETVDVQEESEKEVKKIEQEQEDKQIADDVVEVEEINFAKESETEAVVEEMEKEKEENKETQLLQLLGQAEMSNQEIQEVQENSDSEIKNEEGNAIVEESDFKDEEKLLSESEGALTDKSGKSETNVQQQQQQLESEADLDLALIANSQKPAPAAAVGRSYEDVALEPSPYAVGPSNYNRVPVAGLPYQSGYFNPPFITSPQYPVTYYQQQAPAHTVLPYPFYDSSITPGAPSLQASQQQSIPFANPMTAQENPYSSIATAAAGAYPQPALLPYANLPPPPVNSYYNLQQATSASSPVPYVYPDQQTQQPIYSQSLPQDYLSSSYYSQNIYAQQQQQSQPYEDIFQPSSSSPIYPLSPQLGQYYYEEDYQSGIIEGAELNQNYGIDQPNYFYGAVADQNNQNIYGAPQIGITPDPLYLLPSSSGTPIVLPNAKQIDLPSYGNPFPMLLPPANLSPSPTQPHFSPEYQFPPTPNMEVYEQHQMPNNNVAYQTPNIEAYQQSLQQQQQQPPQNYNPNTVPPPPPPAYPLPIPTSPTPLLQGGNNNGYRYLMTSTYDPNENYIVECELPYPNPCTPVYIIPVNSLVPSSSSAAATHFPPSPSPSSFGSSYTPASFEAQKSMSY